MTARTIMVQGTASSVGKSLLVTALCRMFAQRGLRVAPFKAQNMALNAAVTRDGLEIGRAQAAQAEAAGVEPTAHMNPILLKPEGEARAQVVVLGKPVGAMPALRYHDMKVELRGVIADSLALLRDTYDLVVIEGAGSPAEVNLKARDLVNMFVAKLAEAPVILAGDIDRGGVFAALVGTLELLDPDERDRVAALLINKFRGDLALLQPGLDFLTERTQKPLLGVVPFVPGLRLPDEDSLSLDARAGRGGGRAPEGHLDIAVVRLPRIANHDDVEPLEHEPGVFVRFTGRPEDLRAADLVILPGSKSTVSDLAWLRREGLAAAIAARARAGEPVVGICGGCQMLGEEILDPHGVESDSPRVPGLGLLPLRTAFAREKLTARVEARAARRSILAGDRALGDALSGYEIHMGQVAPTRAEVAAFILTARSGEPTQTPDGAVSDDGAVVGTLIHGLLENDSIRADLLEALRARRGIPIPTSARPIPTRAAEYDRLAEAVRASVDRELLWRLAGQSGPCRL